MLCPGCGVPWKSFLKDKIESIGGYGVYNLCLFRPGRVAEGLEPFEREVWEAWKALRPLVEVVLATRDQLKALHYVSTLIDLLTGPSGRREMVCSGVYEMAGWYVLEMFSIVEASLT